MFASLDIHDLLDMISADDDDMPDPDPKVVMLVVEREPACEPRVVRWVDCERMAA